jgi:hypothetical protein
VSKGTEFTIGSDVSCRTSTTTVQILDWRVDMARKPPRLRDSSIYTPGLRAFGRICSGSLPQVESEGTHKELNFNEAARRALERGVKVVGNAVEVTAWPDATVRHGNAFAGSSGRE